MVKPMKLSPVFFILIDAEFALVCTITLVRLPSIVMGSEKLFPLISRELSVASAL